MIRLAGGSDGLGREGQPSVQATWADIAAYAPEVVVLMPCGYHLEACLDEFRETPMPPEWEGLTAVKSGEVYVVDGSSFYNRPGPQGGGRPGDSGRDPAPPRSSRGRTPSRTGGASAGSRRPSMTLVVVRAAPHLRPLLLLRFAQPG